MTDSITEIETVATPAPMQSQETAELFTALAKAQGEIENATKDKKNPHFKNRYADLASVWDAIRGPLSKHGLSVVQLPRPAPAGMVEIETRLCHSSGQWIGSTLRLKLSKDDAQGAGSGITYARRYSLSAIVGVAPEDDDGNAASGRGTASTSRAVELTDDMISRILGTADLEALEKVERWCAANLSPADAMKAGAAVEARRLQLSDKPE